jgi:hypothetical protein
VDELWAPLSITPAGRMGHPRTSSPVFIFRACNSLENTVLCIGTGMDSLYEAWGAESSAALDSKRVIGTVLLYQLAILFCKLLVKYF